MNIPTFPEGLYHLGVLGKRSHDPQFNLRVIGGKQNMLIIPGNKGLSNLPALVSPNRNVLQVGIFRTKSAGGCHQLVESRYEFGGPGDLSSPAKHLHRWTLAYCTGENQGCPEQFCCRLLTWTEPLRQWHIGPTWFSWAFPTIVTYQTGWAPTVWEKRC